jgi:hypothetical protein
MVDIISRSGIIDFSGNLACRNWQNRDFFCYFVKKIEYGKDTEVCHY